MGAFVDRWVVPEPPMQEGVGAGRVCDKMVGTSFTHYVHVFINKVSIYFIVTQGINDIGHLPVSTCVIVTQKAHEEGSIQVIMEQAS